MNISMVDLKVQYQTYKQELDKAVIDVMESTAFINGPEVSAFEREMAEYSKIKYGVGLASGTDALLMALLALGIGKGDEVIVPTFTFIATSEMVSRAGATPIFVDIDPDTFNIDPNDVRRKITPKTKAIIPVHLYGQCADLDAITSIAKEHNLKVIEDCAQAQGATWKGKQVGTIGDIGCFSFFPTKNLGGFGDGGLVITDDEKVAETIKALRNHGSFKRYYHSLHGFNSRLDSMQAAILRVKMHHLERWISLRRDVASRYNKALKNSAYNLPKEGYKDLAPHTYNQYTIKVPEKRNELQTFLTEKGIASMIYYPLSLHKQEIYKEYGYKQGDFPASESVEDHVLSIPVYPELTIEQTDYIIAALLEFQRTNL